jgi:hypothetical protein
MAYTKYSLTPADNNSAPPNGAPEGMLPSAVNDTMRDMMSQIRDVGDGIRGGTYTMTAPVITGGSITGVALSGNTLTNPVITGGSINNTPIGASTANTGAFTTLSASSTATLSALTASTALALNGSKNVVSVTNTGTGNNVLATSPTLVTPVLGTPSSGTLTSCTDLPIVAGTTGTLSVARGGTGATTLTANNVLLGNGTSAPQVVAPGTSGNVLKSNGTTWTSAAEQAQVYPGAGVAVSTGSAWGTSKTTPSGDIVGTTDTQTLSAKRVNPRVVAASGTTGNLTIAGDTTDVYKAEGLTGAITLLQPSGTPVDGQKLMIRLEDNGTARAITWTVTAGAFREVGITLPVTTTATKITYVGCVYNSTDSFWDAVATVTQA